MKNWNDFKGILPYASELFGIYQPLVGWKSRLTSKRFDGFRTNIYREVASHALSAVRAPVKVRVDRTAQDDNVAASLTRMTLKIENLKPLVFLSESEPHLSEVIDSGVARIVSKEIGSKPPKDWKNFITYERMTKYLEVLKEMVTKPDEMQKYPDVATYFENFAATFTVKDSTELLQALFDKEARVSGYLVFLAQHSTSELEKLFFKSPKSDIFSKTVKADPLLNFGSGKYEGILSPVGIVHLFREYFFELDSFLGPPVGHIWLSPGSNVELIETSSRKAIVERSLEQATEMTLHSEAQITVQDDVSDAVKAENRDEVKFGFTNTANYSTPVFQDNATATFSIDAAKMNSRETAHKKMRQQSEKLSSEIKRSFKSTFKTSTETTDVSSKRYLLTNSTNKLVNYELRRKMRKVGVQVQDIGIQMCWHAFVDDVGRDLGLGQLVHIGEPPELADLVQPDQPEAPVAKPVNLSINIPFVGLDTDDTDIAYTNGSETEVGFLDSTEHIRPDFPQEVFFQTPNFTLANVTLDSQGHDAKVSIRNLQSDEGSSKGTFTVHLDYIHWHGQSSININATLIWEPTEETRAAVKAEYEKRMAAYSAEKSRRFKEAFYKSARERIKLASQIRPRPSEDLREEERTVVYRKLISQLMSVGTPDAKHVTSELVRSIFDVDKMLYFVAPEWWTPRLHRSAQHLGELVSNAKSPTNYNVKFSILEKTVVPSNNIVSWGGFRENNRDNYYITEESSPAKLGSSLGWLLQLDGDNLRNAVLNSPWVKAVIPIRIGKEKEAINWLEQAHVEGSDGLDAEHFAAPDDPPELKSTPSHKVTVREALNHLIAKIHEFDRISRAPIISQPSVPESPNNHFAGSLPTEAVFEHGFYPLKGGVKFNQDGVEQAIFSQWMEILPTDQIAALEVEYDPKTLQVKDTPATLPKP